MRERGFFLRVDVKPVLGFSCSRLEAVSLAAQQSLPCMPVAAHNVVLRGQFLQPHRAVGVDLRGADADLSTQAQLETVVEPRGVGSLRAAYSRCSSALAARQPDST